MRDGHCHRFERRGCCRVAAAFAIRAVFFVSLGVAVSVATATPAWASTLTRMQVQGRLEKAPRGLSAADVADLGASGGPLLAQIANDRTVATPIRLRAMAALTYVATPGAHDFLEAFVIRKRPSSDPVDRALLRKAAIALGWQSGPRTVEVLSELLDHTDVEVRLDAVIALGLTRTRRAEKPLRDRLAVEADAAVHAQIENQLKTLVGDAPAK